MQDQSAAGPAHSKFGVLPPAACLLLTAACCPPRAHCLLLTAHYRSRGAGALRFLSLTLFPRGFFTFRFRFRIAGFCGGVFDF